MAIISKNKGKKLQNISWDNALRWGCSQCRFFGYHHIGKEAPFPRNKFPIWVGLVGWA
jgi:hypothetical protein